VRPATPGVTGSLSAAAAGQETVMVPFIPDA
jgi:hypothetical protein